MSINEIVALKIRELRESSFSGKGISQTELAKKLNKTPNTISRWETGEYKPKIEDLYELAKFFKVSILTFLPGDTVGTDKDQKIDMMFRGMAGLSDNELAEVSNYLEFYFAKKQLNAMQKKSPGRKRKDESITI
ncbi:helix-turn-helix transcriptional regulator [Leptospira paudalimensis]|uniref:Helix-turn-helix domain-containing protein n=1 Tax=Leptospira paudalimensis TaxID=2950024 RepID=A0ABT3M689_9LEPT|nr:helix-turn-helix transcriptional regulator [Leptospira paudalimensis]MCW7503888.1 helix-turn-helix domain-containing protein [Leptospira paudalimensis]